MTKNYRALGRDLKKLGLVDYDLSNELSRGQKSRITKLTMEFGHVLKHPELFHIAKVSDKTAKSLRATGHKVTPTNKAIIALHEYQGARIDGRKGVIVFRNGRMEEEVHLATHKTFHKKLKELSGKKLKRNEMLTVSIGANGPFKSRFRSYSDLYKYLQQFAPRDPGASLESLLPQMSIVHIHSPRKTTNAKKKDSKKNRGS